TGANPETVLRDFLHHRMEEEPAAATEGEDAILPLLEPDSELFTTVVRGTLAFREDLDRMIANALSRDWTMERLEAVLRNILRAGAFELTQRREVPPKVAISEYVDVAHAFYAGAEPGLVNAVMDRIARVFRTDELEGGGGRAGD
ncbi:MAG: transcription antitermination factor NusB, partial [Rhodospirillales bacterium]|nr:transcription antitermination factor NusB [Rhodospirillales bacterium]